MTTKLGGIQARGNGQAKTETDSALARFMSAGTRGEFTTLPLLGRVWIELAAHDTLNEVEGETYATMKALGLALDGVTGLTYDRERLARILARAVRDPDDPKHEKPFGTVDQWMKLDEDLIVACANVYADTRARLDPVGEDSLTREEMIGIAAALQKKSAMGLRFFGVAKLALYMLTTASPPATSVTPPSSPGDSSPATTSLDESSTQ